jgi:hypothetical protein
MVALGELLDSDEVGVVLRFHGQSIIRGNDSHYHFRCGSVKHDRARALAATLCRIDERQQRGTR